LSFAFSNSNVLENDDVLIRRTDDFIKQLAEIRSNDERKGFNIIQQFNYVTFNIMGMYVLQPLVSVNDASGEMSFGESFDARLEKQPEHRYHWADVIVNTTYMNDVMRAVCVIPGLFSFLERFNTDYMTKTLYRHAEYATEHTKA